MVPELLPLIPPSVTARQKRGRHPLSETNMELLSVSMKISPDVIDSLLGEELLSYVSARAYVLDRLVEHMEEHLGCPVTAIESEDEDSVNIVRVDDGENRYTTYSPRAIPAELLYQLTVVENVAWTGVMVDLESFSDTLEA